MLGQRSLSRTVNESKKITLRVYLQYDYTFFEILKNNGF